MQRVKPTKKTRQAAQELGQEFSKPWNQSDVVLIVEGQHFHVHRVILAMFSPVFSRMFSSDFKEKDADEIPLPEKKAAVIREMLMVIYPIFNKPVNDTNLDFLLPLAREYQMTVLTQRCEDHLLRAAEEEHEIGPILGALIVAQTYALERLIAQCINKTQKLAIEEVQRHELYEQIEPASQRKMIELQVSSMQEELRDAKQEISMLQNKIRKMEASASNGLQSFESLVATLGKHIRHAKKIKESSLKFQITTEQNMETIRSDVTDMRYMYVVASLNTSPRSKRLERPERSEVCLDLSPAYDDLKRLQDNLKAINNSDDLAQRNPYANY